MAIKTYQVQTWDEAGALTNTYLTNVASGTELTALRKFLRTKFAHVVLTVQPTARKKRRG